MAREVRSRKARRAGAVLSSERRPARADRKACRRAAGEPQWSARGVGRGGAGARGGAQDARRRVDRTHSTRRAREKKHRETAKKEKYM